MGLVLFGRVRHRWQWPPSLVLIYGDPACYRAYVAAGIDFAGALVAGLLSAKQERYGWCSNFAAMYVNFHEIAVFIRALVSQRGLHWRLMIFESRLILT